MATTAAQALAALRAAGVTATAPRIGNVSYMPDASDNTGCGGNGSPFANYAPAGLLTVNVPGPGAQIAFQTIDITGADLPPGSVLVLDRRNGTGAVAIASIQSDGAPQAIGQGGIGLAIASLNNQNAPGVYLALNSTRTLTIGVQFDATTLATDFVVFQVLSKGGRSVQNQVCGR